MDLAKRFHKQPIVSGLLGLLILSLLTVGSYAVYSMAIAKPSSETRRGQKTVSVERLSLPIAVSANGTIQPERSVNVSPKTSGMLKSLLVKEGDRVEQGQLLAYMDDSNLRGQLTQAQGQVASAEANLQKLLNGNRAEDIAVARAQLVEQQANLQKLLNGNRPEDIAAARGQLAEQQANLQKVINGNRSQDIAQARSRLTDAQYALRQAGDDLQRNQELYTAGAIALQSLNTSRTTRDRAQTQVKQAEEALALLQAGARPEEIAQARAAVQQRQEALALLEAGSRPEDIAQARAVVQQRQEALALLEAGSRPEDIAQARAQVASAKGSVQTIEALINDTVIRAAFSGIVTRKYADPGAFVTPTTAGSAVSSATSSSILSLASTNQVVANVAETNISQIRLKQEVTIQADAYPGKTFTGQVNQISPQSIVQQNVTSFEVKVGIVDDPQGLLRSGMNANVEFKVGELKDAVVVPTVAIVRQENGTGVFIADENMKPKFTPIVTGITVNDKTEIRSGLKGNEKIFISSPPSSRARRSPSPSSGIPGLQPGPRLR
ncbi:efflux RND transporter periplasmic adaptor subunit [Kamptonema sp. UHCC 0994]|uniref:efflux RND transporter periplasmic adaptor subunit n=1 Tax=Kamptonema sp. UHCC 0994 TaxID=3031329 RepID=UPI0023B8F800|nr:efflux RND transporter periplasmic adaptor subunit [Kamptonema sp. UHCC 0994]MDF0555435.1 efflux RND transporter periplasmic adaptor subunit [Kamptonema sp. UHCC 0994]